MRKQSQKVKRDKLNQNKKRNTCNSVMNLRSLVPEPNGPALSCTPVILSTAERVALSHELVSAEPWPVSPELINLRPEGVLH